MGMTEGHDSLIKSESTKQNKSFVISLISLGLLLALLGVMVALFIQVSSMNNQCSLTTVQTSNRQRQTATKVFSDSEDQCIPGWHQFEKNFYFFQMGLSLNWSQAEQNCVCKGGHLASIHSEEENDFIKQRINSSSWIGGNDQQSEGNFRWTDETLFDYTDWGSGEPNNWSGQDCLQLYSSMRYEWDDDGCEKAHSFVCKIPLNNLLICSL